MVLSACGRSSDNGAPATGRVPARRGAAFGSPRLIAVGLLGVLGWAGGTVVALDRGPVVQANLITYLWPVLVVLLAPLAWAGVCWRPDYLTMVGACSAAMFAGGVG